MALPLLLREEDFKLELGAKTPEMALKEMVKLLPDTLSIYKKKKIFETLFKRETFGTTAIGGGVALPHCVTDLSVPLASLGISRGGIPFPSLDGTLVHFVYLLLVPENNQTHTILRDNLREAERIFRDVFLKQRLLLAETIEEAYEIFARESQHLNGLLKAS